MKVETKIIMPAGAHTKVEKSPSGWGPDYQAVNVNAQVIDLTVMIGDRGGVGIRINADGDLTITNFGGCYDTQVPQNMRLTNSRPWSKVKT